MMKINYKVFTVLALTSLMFTSCDEGDAVVDTVTANTLRGAILRTIEVTSNELPIDGRTYSFAQNSGTLTGSYFASPFLYTATIVCPPTPPSSGDWTIDMVDAYGDGWNGAFLTVTLDGTEYIYKVADGTSDTFETLAVPVGSEVISIQFTSGAWDGEIQYTITAANGDVILSQEAYADTTTAPDVELINYCIKNF